ncbi:monocarboxylate transporter 13 [Rhagoletis pomonella]|uniref:monocarboxylate transporter 13 n=1 Tax=Rhagoletis pomonella TaxID=28610 RepID=UPI001783546F|nr:monocarboxylate transporter 13 [Rhagoletis pomonella]
MKRHTRLEAPDGGWGVFVCIGMALPFISGLAALPSFGLVFGDFLKNIGAETSAVAVITSAFFCALSFAGLFSGSMFNRFGLRAVGLMGGFLYFFGSLLQIFARSTWDLLFAFSIVQGIGFGLIVPTSYTTFNNYFVKKRVMWMSFAQSLIGLGTMFYPVVMQKLMDLYGFRGCLLVLAAINAHAILGMLLMQPVEWHMRKVIICEEQQLTVIKTSLPTVENEVKIINALPVLKTTSAASEQHARNWWQLLVNFLDLTLLQLPIYVNIVLGISFALYSDIAFFTLQPLYLFELGFTKADTASIIAIGAAADLISRILLAFSAVFIQMPSRYIYLAGSFFTIIARFAFINVFNFRDIACATTVMGFLRTWIHVPLPLVFAEYLPNDRFATGYGLFMFLQGNITFAIGPLVGYLHDQTRNYVLTFHCLNFFMALCFVPWVLELVCVKFRRKKTLGSGKKVNCGI